jgi:hypothetical protein
MWSYKDWLQALTGVSGGVKHVGGYVIECK